MITLKLPNGQLRQVAEGDNLLALAQEFASNYASPIVEGIFNGAEYDLQKPLLCDGSVEFMELNAEDGYRVYIRSLLFLMLVAAKKVRPDVDLEVRNTLGSALYCLDRTSQKLSVADLQAITAYMRELIVKAEPIILHRVSKTVALAKPDLKTILSEDKIALLKELPEDAMLTVYELAGEYGYFFGSMIPNCSLLSKFELLHYQDGVIINYPDLGKGDVLPSFVNQAKMNTAFQEMEEWTAMLQCNTIGKLNRIIGAGYADKLIHVAEGLHEKKLIGIADMIAARPSVKLILIAGPSSSGKTSTAQRLSTQLAVNGIIPFTLSMDDYYRNREETPKKSDGSYDFECIEAIDIPLFNEHLTRLLNGERVELPKFNFKTGEREYRGNELQLTEKSVLIVEGIHGLNETLTASIPAEKKVKVYVSALTPLSFDEHNRIHTTDMRLLRRMVRDSQFRGFGAEHTLKMWKDVREGEEKYIFPFQGDADIIFNTTLIYELGVLKKYAEPLLLEVQSTSPKAYLTAQRLLKLLRYVHVIDNTEAVPNNSILKEFIGGSTFKDAL